MPVPFIALLAPLPGEDIWSTPCDRGNPRFRRAHPSFDGYGAKSARNQICRGGQWHRSSVRNLLERTKLRGVNSLL
jgi:hypothetical protein